MMHKTPPLKIKYGKRVVLDVPAMIFEDGKIYALIGANGSGKSSFGKNCGFSYQPQKPYMFKMSVYKNLKLAAKSKEEVNIALRDFNLVAFKNARADKLSGGESAKVALARTLLSRQKTIVLDEATNSMDMEGCKISEYLIRRYADEGNTVILITHSMRQAERIADEIIFLKDGMINKNEKDLKAFMDFYA